MKTLITILVIMILASSCVASRKHDGCTYNKGFIGYGPGPNTKPTP